MIRMEISPSKEESEGWNREGCYIINLDQF